MTPLDLAKHTLGIPELWQMRGWRGRPGKSCRVPWREDRAPSGSVLAGGRLFHEFTSGETLDAPGLLARVEDMAPDAACRLFIQLAGTDARAGSGHRPPPPPSRSQPAPPPLPTPQLPPLQRPSEAELQQIAALRDVSVAACAEAARRGHLYCADWRGVRCWIVTDNARHTAQARRLDGQPFATQDGGSVKALTLPGSCASWPVGTADAGTARRVILCEGGGDFLAAYHFAEAEGVQAAVQPLAMLGAAQRIHPASLPHLAGKRVRIFPHMDGAGAGAALRWESQLRAAGIAAHCFDLAGLSRDDGATANDLNDLTRIAAEDFDANPELCTLATF